jgi:hypothetical protein
MTRTKHYKVAVYFRDDAGIWHPHGTWEDTANSPADAKYRALDALSDHRVEGWKAEILADRPATPKPPRNRA